MHMQKEPAVDYYHGTAVIDPYRWLENLSAEETRAWIRAQSQATQVYFGQIPFTHAIRTALQANWDYPRSSVPKKRGTRFFFSRNDGLQQQSVLYMQRGLLASPELLLDPNTLSTDGTVALRETFLSMDGTLLAYGLSRKGSDWLELRIRQLDANQDLPETLHRWRGSTVAWQPDNTGFYYSRYPDPETVAAEDQTYFNRVYWHRLGTSQTDDQLVFEQPEAKECR